MVELRTVGIALALAAGAGLSTTIGGALALLVKKPGPRFMAFTLGFSGGVMVLVSFVELLGGSIESIGFASAHAAFFLGMLIFFFIDVAVPHDYISQEEHTSPHSDKGLMRVGLLIAMGIAIHNFPEGMATFVSALKDVNVGIAVAVAIAIHNIPEGIAVAAPVYAATGSRRKAFWWSFLAGVSEPAGAVLAALVLLPFMSETVMGWIMAGVAGIMVAISLDEIIPTAKQELAQGRQRRRHRGGDSSDLQSKAHHIPIAGVIFGMFVMALSLWLLK